MGGGDQDRDEMKLPEATEPSRAVFLSYASQDAEAAQRICEALRAAGVEVWFDQSELRGGDAWDQKIRRQIKECALFVPVISANTQARGEGYFRLEWKLAVDRSHLMADDAPFLFPVVIDDTPDATARVPDRFREVQWTRLNVKDTPETLAARVSKLLGGAPAPPRAARTGGGCGPQAGELAARRLDRRRPCDRTGLRVSPNVVAAASRRNEPTGGGHDFDTGGGARFRGAPAHGPRARAELGQIRLDGGRLRRGRGPAQARPRT